MRAAVVAALLVACSGSSTPAPPAPAPAPPAPAAAPAHEDHAAMMMAQAPFEPAAEGAKVAFASPTDGATVSAPVKLVFSVEGMALHRAGEAIAGTGHHHVIIDGEPVAEGEVVPTDDKHVHFGDGRTETDLALPAGEHTLTLQFADGLHRSYGPRLSSTIKVNVSP